MEEKRKLSDDDADLQSKATGNLSNKKASDQSDEEKLTKNKTAQDPDSNFGIGLGTARRPPDRSFKEKVKYFFFNPEEESCMGRTPKSWTLIILFYIFFYAALCGLWLACWTVFLRNVMGEGPKYTRLDGLIGNKPGVGVFPNVSQEKLKSVSTERPKYDLKNDANILENENARLATQIEFMFDKYKLISNQSTSFDVKNSLGNCSLWPFGYKDDVQPCFYLTLNKIWGWTPEEINSSDFATNVWPKELEDRWKKSSEKRKVFFNCEALPIRDGVKITKVENPVNFTYYPSDGGLDFRYFPFEGNSSSYLQPIVAVKLALPRPAPKFKARWHLIECKAYYAGVVHNSKLGQLQSLIQFEVRVKDTR